MKNGKRLKLQQKKILSKLGLNPDDFLRVKQAADNFTIINIHTGQTQDIRY